jgi:hypothetical protein
VSSGLNPEAARRLGGGDVFWMTEDLAIAGYFAAANPLGGRPAIVATRLSQSTLESLAADGVIQRAGAGYRLADV